jgi:hypothetical protein
MTVPAAVAVRARTIHERDLAIFSRAIAAPTSYPYAPASGWWCCGAQTYIIIIISVEMLNIKPWQFMLAISGQQVLAR